MNIRVDICDEAELGGYLRAGEILEESLVERYFLGILQREALPSLPEGPVLEVGISFLKEPEMASLNAEYRGKTESTDILSFPQWNFFEDPPAFSPDEGWECVPLGDLVVSPEDVLVHAREEGHSFYRELILVLTHGLLHLLGYDHDNPEAERVMFALQEEYCRDFFERLQQSQHEHGKEKGDVMRA